MLTSSCLTKFLFLYKVFGELIWAPQGPFFFTFRIQKFFESTIGPLLLRTWKWQFCRNAFYSVTILIIFNFTFFQILKFVTLQTPKQLVSTTRFICFKVSSTSTDILYNCERIISMSVGRIFVRAANWGALFWVLSLKITSPNLRHEYDISGVESS